MSSENEEKLSNIKTIQQLQSLHNSMWLAGGKGFLVGGILGGVGALIARTLPSFKQKKFNNILMASVLIGGCLGSFVNTAVYGKRGMEGFGSKDSNSS